MFESAAPLANGVCASCVYKYVKFLYRHRNLQPTTYVRYASKLYWVAAASDL